MNDKDRSKGELLRELGRLRGEYESIEGPVSKPGSSGDGRNPATNSGGSSEIHTLLVTIATRLIESTPEEFDSWAREPLRAVGEFTGARRCFVLLFHDRSRSVIEETFEWCVEGVDPRMHKLRGVDVEGFPWLMQKLSHLEILQVSQISEFPPEAETEKNLAGSLGIHSGVFLALMRSGVIQGILGLAVDKEDIIRSGETLTLLHAVGKIIVSKLERRREKEALSRNNTQLHALFASTPIPLFVIDHHRRIHRTNRAARAFCGLTEEEMVGRSIGGAMHCVNQVEGNDECESAPACEDCVLRRTILGIFETGEEILGLETDLTVAGNGGSETRTVRINASLFDKTEIPRVIVGLEDITEQKRTEAVVWKERDIAQKYLDVVRVILVAIDSHQQVTLINRMGCEILEYGEEEIIGKNWFDCFLPDTIKAEVKDVFKRLMAGEVDTRGVKYFENPVRTKSGREVLIRWHNTILRDEEGNITGTLSSGEDFTEQKRAEEELLRQRIRFEKLLEERTAKLSALNDSLLKEKAERKRLEEKLARVLSRTTGGGNRSK